MSGVNKVILVGHLGKDPEIRNFENGGMIANFTLATSETFKDKTTGEKREITEWHNITIGRPQLAEIAQKYVHKGDLLYVEGKLRTRSWEKDGQKKYITEVLVDEFTMLSTKKNNENSPNVGYSKLGPSDSTPATSGSSDDLPF